MDVVNKSHESRSNADAFANAAGDLPMLLSVPAAGQNIMGALTLVGWLLKIKILNEFGLLSLFSIGILSTPVTVICSLIALFYIGRIGGVRNRVFFYIISCRGFCGVICCRLDALVGRSV
jgi:hypothetical protein